MAQSGIVRAATPRSLAYLIYSTGLPKGVRCHHQGAMNTIHDLNSEFRVDQPVLQQALVAAVSRR